MLDILEDLREIERIAWSCVNYSLRRSQLPSLQAGFEAAYDAVVELITESAALGLECSVYDIKGAGLKAVASAAKLSNNWAPIVDDDGVEWRPQTKVPSFEGRLVNRIAFRQVMQQMDPDHQQVLAVYALHRDTKAAARHLGISKSALCRRVSAARSAFFDAWFDWEPAPRVPRLDVSVSLSTHCGNGHEYTPENTGFCRRARNTARTKRYCKECERNQTQRRADRRRSGVKLPDPVCGHCGQNFPRKRGRAPALCSDCRANSSSTKDAS